MGIPVPIGTGLFKVLGADELDDSATKTSKSSSLQNGHASSNGTATANGSSSSAKYENDETSRRAGKRKGVFKADKIVERQLQPPLKQRFKHADLIWDL